MAAMITVDFQYCIMATILLCIFTFLCLYLIFRKQTHGIDLPPSPPSLPIIGHLHYLLLSFLHHKSFLHYKSFHTLSSKYGPLLHLQFFFFPAILVSSAPVAYQILMTHDVNISSRNLFSDASGFFTAPYGEYFKFMKKLIVTNMFGPQALEHSRSIRADELERSYMNLVDKAKKKESVDIKKEAMELIGNIICRMSFGRRFTEEIGEADSVQGSVIKSSGTKKKMILEILFFFEILLFRQVEKLGISLFKKDITAVLKKLNELLEKILLEHKEKPNMNGYNDMMDVLLSVYEGENADYKITKNHIKAFFVELIFGGIDTNVITIQWTMAEIVNNPIIMERLREEIDSVVGKSRLIQETDLPNLPYLQAVIKEGLRLHPPVPQILREFQQGCKIGGFFVPEKTKLIVNLYAVMRDPDFWEDPLEFKPERFLTSSRSGQEEERNEQAMKYLPFGGGRRGCPASKLSYMALGTTIGMMVQCFEWRIIGEKVNMDDRYKCFSKTMAHPLTLTPVTRLSNLELKNLVNLQT